jgi:VWFA-related protein
MMSGLVQHLWESTVFAACAGLLTLLFRNSRAGVRYWIWFCASLKFLTPFAPLESLGRHVELAPAARRIAAPVFAMAAGEPVRVLAPGGFVAPRGKPGVEWLPETLFAIWACGFAAVVVMRWRDWRRVRAAVRTSVPAGVWQGVEMRAALGLFEPAVAGFRKPVLLVPEGIAERLTPMELETVLAHELCHVRRLDNLTAAIHMLVEALFWFHPAAWWIGARLIQERERACDEEVLRLGSEPATYARAIVNVCKWYAEAPLACMPGVTGGGIQGRIEAIMNGRNGRALNGAKKLILAAAGAAALAIPVVLGIVAGAGSAQVLHAQVPPVQTSTSPEIAPSVAIAAPQRGPRAAPQSATAGRGSSANETQSGRLIVLFFDLDSMTAADEARAQQAAQSFLYNKVQTADQAAVMTAKDGAVKVTSDFTADRSATVAAILGLELASGSGASSGPNLTAIESAARVLSPIAGKKALVYFTDGVASSVDPASLDAQQWQRTMNSLVQAYTAVYAINMRGLSGVTGNVRVEGVASGDAALLEVLSRESQSRGGPALTNLVAGLPGGHAVMEIRPSGERQLLSVPLVGLTGRVDILAQIPNAASGGITANNRAALDASRGSFELSFVLKPGSYVCNVVVAEASTGRAYGETIRFDVK